MNVYIRVWRSGRFDLSRKNSICASAFSALVAMLLLTNNAVHAQEQDPFAIYVKAGIDPTQHAQITELATQVEQTNIGRSHEIMNLIKDIRVLSLQPDLDEKKILAAQSKINDLQGAMVLERLKLNMKVRKLLTPEQRMKLVAIIKEQRAMPSPVPNTTAGPNTIPQ